jgi:Asp/Glu/hydantoin racemase
MGLRIWYQSSVAIGANPVFKPYEEAIARNMREVVRPDTAVDINGVQLMNANFGKSKYARYLNGMWVIRLAAKAEALGYDAIAVGCYTDPCLPEVRDTVGIPAVYIMQTSMHFACMLGEKFAFMGYDTTTLRIMEQLAQRYQLQHRLAGVGNIRAQLSKSDEWFSDPGPILDRFGTEARKCIAQGADVLIPACGVLNQVLRENKVREIDGCRILDGSSLLIKVTEAMADLHRLGGTPWSRGGLSAETMREVDRAYGIE